MGRDEQDILDFLKQFDTYVSESEIAKRVGGKRRFREDRTWARPILERLVIEGLIEADAYDHYRIKAGSGQKKESGKKNCYYSFGCKTYVLDDDEPFAIAQDALRGG